MDSGIKNYFHGPSAWGFSKTGFSTHVSGKPDISLINVEGWRILTKDIALTDLTTPKPAMSTKVPALNHVAIPTLNLSMFHSKVPIFKSGWTSVVNMKSPEGGNGGEGSSGNEPDTGHGSSRK